MVTKSATKTDSQSSTADQQKWLAEALGRYGGELGQNENVWQGERVKPFSTLQEKAVTGAGNYADYFSTPQQVGTPLKLETGSAIGGLLTGETGAKPLGPEDIESYFGRAIRDPAKKSLKEDVLPGVDEAYSGPGFWGSARSHERVDRTADTADYLSQQRAGLEWDAEMYNRGLAETKAGRTQAAIPQAMAYGQVPAQEIKNNLQIAAAQLGELGNIFNIGSAEQTQEQAMLESEIMKFAEENAITDPENLAIMLSLLGMNYSSSTTRSWGEGYGPTSVAF